MTSMGKVLDIVGNENRRKILELLSKEPQYISEIARKLNVTQPAILKHLDLLQAAGLISSFWKKNPLGAARKYYKIRDSIGIEIAINPKNFRITRRGETTGCSKRHKTEQTIKLLTEEINNAKDATAKGAKALELMKTAESLLLCTEYKRENYNCENCHRVASLRKQTSQIILHVTSGDMENGLRKLSEIVNQIAARLNY